jgi:hypothetical protein
VGDEGTEKDRCGDARVLGEGEVGGFNFEGSRRGGDIEWADLLLALWVVAVVVVVAAVDVTFGKCSLFTLRCFRRELSP